MSDDNSGDIGLATPVEQDEVIDQVLDGLVEQELIGNYAISARRVYDGLIRAARRVRRGRPLSGEW